MSAYQQSAPVAQPANPTGPATLGHNHGLRSAMASTGPGPLRMFKQSLSQAPNAQPRVQFGQAQRWIQLDSSDDRIQRQAWLAGYHEATMPVQEDQICMNTSTVLVITCLRRVQLL